MCGNAVLVEGDRGYYYETFLDDINLDPVRARRVKSGRGQSVPFPVNNC